MKRSRPTAQRTTTASEPSNWVHVVTLPPDDFTAEGFGRGSDDGSVGVLWSSIVRVAMGYEIHPVAVADWDFWAFQTIDPQISYWVYCDLASAFSEEVRRRFAVGEVPAMQRWSDSKFCIRAYVVWPAEETGEPMYLTVKPHWWSWRGRLTYAKVLVGAG